ncbi:hypothetical protein LINGRAHAP2_LOCUS25527, partial [Linum grandiflorum]
VETRRVIQIDGLPPRVVSVISVNVNGVDLEHFLPRSHLLRSLDHVRLRRLRALAEGPRKLDAEFVALEFVGDDFTVLECDTDVLLLGGLADADVIDFRADFGWKVDLCSLVYFVTGAQRVASGEFVDGDG